MAYYRLSANGPSDDDMRVIAKVEGRARFSIVTLDDGVFQGDVVMSWRDGTVDTFPAFARFRRIKPHLFELAGSWDNVQVRAVYDADSGSFAREMTDKKLIGREFVTLECFLQGLVDIAREAGVRGGAIIGQ